MVQPSTKSFPMASPAPPKKKTHAILRMFKDTWSRSQTGDDDKPPSKSLVIKGEIDHDHGLRERRHKESSHMDENRDPNHGVATGEGAKLLLRDYTNEKHDKYEKESLCTDSTPSLCSGSIGPDSTKSDSLASKSDLSSTEDEKRIPLATEILVKCFLLMVSGFVLFLITMPSCFDFSSPLDKACVHPVLPGGILFSLLLIVIFGNISAQLVQSYVKLPGLLGMLATGYVLRNFVPTAMDGLSAKNNSTLRTLALGMIMIRAGMGLDIAKLRAQFGSMAALSTVPCVCEATVIAFVSQWFFPQMSFPWALMLGFVIADVSPAVTTPLLLDFQDRGYGVDKGIPSILLAGGSVNSVLAIVLYSVMWEFSWGDDIQGFAIVELILVKLVVQIVVVGVLAGWAEGCAMSRVWNVCQNDTQRFILITGVAMCNLFGFAKIGMGGGGCLATLTFGAAFQHSVNKLGFEGTKRVQDIIAKIWSKLGSVLLFTLLGASIDQSKLDPVLVACATATILIGLVGRSCATFASCLCLREWTAKERAFAVVSWCPKATVQAALASRALDHVHASVAQGVDRFVSDPSYVDIMTERSEVILTTAVLSIIITAPTFAVLMSMAGERWLTKAASFSP